MNVHGDYDIKICRLANVAALVPPRFACRNRDFGDGSHAGPCVAVSISKLAILPMFLDRAP
jgi:hypothetical protein